MKLNAWVVGIAIFGLSGLVMAEEVPSTPAATNAAPTTTDAATPSPDPAEQPPKLKAVCKPASELLSPIAAGVSEIREIVSLKIEDGTGVIKLRSAAGLVAPESVEDYPVALAPANQELMSLLPTEGYVDGVIGTLFSLADIRIPQEVVASGKVQGVFPATGVLVFITSFQASRAQPRGIYTRHIDLYCDITVTQAQ